MALMQKAAAQKPAGASFKKPDVSQFVPQAMHDTFQRVVAAGMKIMYSPDMKDEMDAAMQSQDPIPKKIADNTTGLLLTLDQQTKGGIPAGALFPAAVELAAEAADVLVAAGQAVSQEDFNDALLMMYAQIGKKLGGSDDELMQNAQQALGQPPGPSAPPDPNAPPQGPPGVPPPAGAMPPADAMPMPPGAVA